eukprot:COSAG06_NODE_3534_length_5216_cov_183.913655_2_plen_88_part_00
MASQKDALSAPAAAIFVPIAVKLRAIPAAAAAQNNKNINNNNNKTPYIVSSQIFLVCVSRACLGKLVTILVYETKRFWFPHQRSHRL